MQTEQDGNLPEELTLEQLQEENLRLKKEALQKENDALRSSSSSQSGNLAQALKDAMNVNSPDHKLQSHGKTVGEMKELRLKQAAGEKPSLVKASNGKDEIREDEQHLIHVYLETVLYNEKGKKVSPPGRFMKFDANDFTRMSEGDRNHFGQYDIIDIIHDPRVKTGSKPVKTKLPATEQNISQLHETYESLYGEKAPADMTIAQMILAIREAKG